MLTYVIGDKVKKVRTRVPRSIVVACISNAIMMFAFVIVLLFTIGDINLVANTLTGVPLVEVYYQATKSKGASTFLTLLAAIIIFFSLFNAFASVSRLVWQFSRDNGLPFSDTFAYVWKSLTNVIRIIETNNFQVHPGLKLPVNALALVGVIIFLLAIIFIPSATAFNAIISMQAIAVHISYVLPILFILLRKIRGPPVEFGPFKLGRFGIPVNLFALCYLIYVIMWMPFSTILPVTGDNMNYAGPIVLLFIIGALIDWIVSGRKRFDIPVAPTLM